MITSSSKQQLIAVIPFVFVLLWSTGFIGAKFGLPYVEPFNFLFLPMLLNLAVFGLLIALFRARWPAPLPFLHQMVVGSLVHAAYLGGVFAAIELDLPAGVTALIVGLQPLVTALLAWGFSHERLTWRQWVGLGLGFVGVALVLLSGQQLTNFTVSLTALALAVVALLGISLGTLYQKRFGTQVNLLTGSFCQYLSAALITGALTYRFETQAVVWHPVFIAALAWSVIVLSVGAILLLMLMIRQGEASKVASYFYLVPPMTALQGWLFFNEQLGAIALLGMVVTVVGVYLVLRRGGSGR